MNKKKIPDAPDHGAPVDSAADDDDGFALSRGEQVDVEEKRPPRAAVLHEIIRSEGDQELQRSMAALGWSSLAAGLSMGFSMLAKGLLHRHLGDLPGAFLIASFGYCFGFLLVILSRQQLFTENTMTAVLPVMTEPTLSNFGRLLRLWLVVLVGNLVGVVAFAFGVLHLQQFDAADHAAFVELGEALMKNTPWQMFTKGILAGWLIAMMVWMLAATQRARFVVIVMVTYVVAIGDFTINSGQVTFGGIVLGTVATLVVYHLMNGIARLRGSDADDAGEDLVAGADGAADAERGTR